MATSLSLIVLANYLNSINTPLQKIQSNLLSSNLKANSPKQFPKLQQIQFSPDSLMAKLLAPSNKPVPQSKIQIITSAPLIKSNDIQAKNIPSVLIKSPLISQNNNSLSSQQLSSWDHLKSSLNNNQKKTQLNVLNTLLDYTNNPANRNISI